MTATEVDYIIVGGGLVGWALASRLQQRNASLEVLVTEAGEDSRMSIPSWEYLP